MISKKDRYGYWGVGVNKLSGPCISTSWGVDSKSHRLYGFQNFSHYFWWVNGKLLNNFKRIEK